MNFVLEHNNEKFRRIFECNQRDNLIIYDFKVNLIKAINKYESFDFQVSKINRDFNIVAEMHNHDYSSLSGKGIAAYMIE